MNKRREHLVCTVCNKKETLDTDSSDRFNVCGEYICVACAGRGRRNLSWVGVSEDRKRRILEEMKGEEHYEYGPHQHGAWKESNESEKDSI